MPSDNGDLVSMVLLLCWRVRPPPGTRCLAEASLLFWLARLLLFGLGDGWSEGCMLWISACRMASSCQILAAWVDD